MTDLVLRTEASCETQHREYRIEISTDVIGRVDLSNVLPRQSWSQSQTTLQYEPGVILHTRAYIAAVSIYIRDIIIQRNNF